ncbi:DUF5719 family protein [Ornithinimicrobium pekingense]|uniref:Secreted protein n=1 Tax=Ornithinimicrobium pekingense TaxID=384677 RepID=A0ABQ2F7E9_9MICO|nr:DUF5719 family protein [Ornithinimicrobium pekingense]GGK67092.1 hypothetical protein GCM10011509_14300 [Ornithinimicrobium pekingense]
MSEPSGQHGAANPHDDGQGADAASTPVGAPAASADTTQAPAGESPRGSSGALRALSSPWWRVGVAVAAVGALTWGVTASDAALRLGEDAPGDGAAATAGAQAGAYVQTAVLACPGTVPWLDDEAASRPAVDVVALGPPASVLGQAPPASGDDASGTAAPDDAHATSVPDEASATSAPDEAASTAAPDEAASTAAPDDAASTAAPDDAASTAAPDEAASTSAPDGTSVLRATDPASLSVDLEHGIPAGISLERASSALVEASGTIAPGVVGGQLGLGTEPGSRGLTLAGCVPAGEAQWLVGGGSAPGRAEQLVLTNPGPDPVTVAVAVWGAEGPVTTTGAGSIVVPGGGRAVELLDGLAPAVDAPVVGVTATGGPVVAHLAETYRDGTTDRGTEVVPPVAAPATDLVVPALPAAPEGHERQVVLRVAAPGDRQAVVELTALTPEGAVRLSDQVTRVPAGSTVDLALDDLPEGATALRLRADEPVTGGARLEVLPAEDDPLVVDPATATANPAEGDAATATDGPDGDGDSDGTEQGEPLLRAAGDVAWVGATAPAGGPAGLALPDRSGVPGAAAALALSAVDATTAWVTWVDEEGTQTSRSVELPNDTTELVALPPEARAVWVGTTGGAGVASAVHVTGGDDRGPLVASSTVPQLPWTRQVTQVRPAVP